MQLKERESADPRNHLVDKISQMPPAILSANAHNKEESRSQKPSYDRLERAGPNASMKEQGSFSRITPERAQDNDRGENYAMRGGPGFSDDGLSVMNSNSANYHERVPSANEYYSVSMPDYVGPAKPSTFQKASASNLANFRPKAAGQNGTSQDNEFFDKNFGSAHDRKKAQQQAMKEQLVNELQQQMDMKKERERREKAMRALEEQKAEERYIRDLNHINEQSVAESKKRHVNIFAEGLNDTDVAADFKKEKEFSNIINVETKRVSQKTILREPDILSVHAGDFLPNNRQQPELSIMSNIADKGRPTDMSFANLKEVLPNYGSNVSISIQPVGRDIDPVGAAIQNFQQPPTKYQEYSQRINDFELERVDEKKRELRMNTNLLYQQLIDLRVGSCKPGREELL